MALLPWLKITYTFLNQLKAFIKPGNQWRRMLSSLYTVMGISTQQFGAFINLISCVYNFILNWEIQFPKSLIFAKYQDRAT